MSEGAEPVEIMKLLVNDLRHPGNKYPVKDLLASKLEWAHSLQDAYLDDDEKKEVNRILKKYKIPHRIQ